MVIVRLLILMMILLSSCTHNGNSKITNDKPDQNNRISNIEDNGEWIEIGKLKKSNGFYLSKQGLIYGLDIYGIDDISTEYYTESYIEERFPISYADANTFKVCINADDEPYAKDDKKVYYAYLNGIMFVDGEDMSGEIYLGDLSIREADAKTFKYLGDGYAVDKNHMYLKGEKIKWDDKIINAYNNDRTKLH